MAICKDCLHINVCKDYASYDKDSIISCDNFKNKADYAPVVRCGDCEFCHEYQKWNFDRYLGCNFNGEIYEVKPTHFCSYGEKESEVQGG